MPSGVGKAPVSKAAEPSLSAQLLRRGDCRRSDQRNQKNRQTHRAPGAAVEWRPHPVRATLHWFTQSLMNATILLIVCKIWNPLQMVLMEDLIRSSQLCIKSVLTQSAMLPCVLQQCDASEPSGSEVVELPHLEEGATGQRYHRPSGHTAHTWWQK